MSDVKDTDIQTSLKDAINICLSCLGERPVDGPDNTSTNVELAKQIIAEVRNDVLSKGWWFNTDDSGNISIYINTGSGASETFNTSIPEEARRYIAIRAARIFQSRFIGSEDLFKFSFEEEKVSLAILTQAHVRNGGNSTSFTSFPPEIKALGVEEVMFLQQSAEEKLLTLKLDTELKITKKLEAEESAILTESILRSQQTFTEIEETAKRNAEIEVVKDQEALLEQQKLTEQQETAKRNREVTLLEKQAEKVDEEVDMLQQQFKTEEFETLKRNNEKHLVFLQQEHLKQQTLTETQETARRNREISVLEVQKTKIEEEIDMLEQQFLTETQETAKRNREVTLLEAQKLKIDEEIDMLQQQFLSEQQETARKNREVTVLEKQASKIDEETDLLESQDALTIQQELTEKQETAKRNREVTLLEKQATKTEEETDLLESQDALTIQQELTEKQETAKRNREVTILEKQATKIDEETDLLEQQFLTEQQETARKNREVSILEVQKTKVEEETDLLEQQFLTEQQETARKNREVSILEVQKTKVEEETDLLEQQFLTEQQETAKRNREVTLLEKQSDKIDEEVDLLEQQFLTEQQETAKRNREVSNIEEQTKLVTAQELKTDAESELITEQKKKTTAEELLVDAQTELTKDQELKTVAEKNILVSQKTQLDAETTVGALAEQNFFNDVKSGSIQTYHDLASELRMMGIQEPAFQNIPAYKKQELIKDAEKMKLAKATETSTHYEAADELKIVNNIMSYIGEAPVSALNTNSMASEAVRLLRQTNKELQGRGWWFNTEYDVDLFSSSNLEAAEVKFNYNAGQDFERLPNYDSGSSVYLLNTVDSTAGGQGKLGTWRAVKGDTGYNITKTSANPPSGTGPNTSNKFRWKINDGGDQEYGLFSTINATDDKSANAVESELDYPWNATWDSSKVTVTQAKMIDLPSETLSVETNDYKTTTRTFRRDHTEYGSGKVKLVKYLYNLETKSFNFIDTPVKAKIIYLRPYIDLPEKFVEYLEVRVSRILTELYPQSGVDVQRLPTMEQELRAYFRDRQDDEANYTMFDNYDTATILGINRPATIL